MIVGRWQLSGSVYVFLIVTSYTLTLNWLTARLREGLQPFRASLAIIECHLHVVRSHCPYWQYRHQSLRLVGGPSTIQAPVVILITASPQDENSERIRCLLVCRNRPEESISLMLGWLLKTSFKYPSDMNWVVFLIGSYHSNTYQFDCMVKRISSSLRSQTIYRMYYIVRLEPSWIWGCGFPLSDHCEWKWMCIKWFHNMTLAWPGSERSFGWFHFFFLLLHWRKLMAY